MDVLTPTLINPKILTRIHKMAIFVAIMAVLCGCSALFCSEEELYRAPSIDGRVDVVLMREACGGVSVPFSYNIYIVQKGNATKKSKPVFVAEHLAGQTIEWVGPKVLQIKYNKADIKAYTNFWYSKYVDNGRYVVEIREGALSEETAIDFEFPKEQKDRKGQ
jgi:hypothetical protein